MSNHKNEKDEFEITDEIIANSSGVIDVFSNEFDITWFNNFDFERKPKKFSILPFNTENAIDDGSVSYEYNSDFFRCDEFTAVHDQKYHVVFGGCSETEGVGGNLDELWAYKLYSELKEKYDIGGYYSLGKSGNGWHKIVLSLINYVEKYGKPTHFFVMLPNIGRNFYWNEENKGWKYLQKYTEIGYPRVVKPGAMPDKLVSPHKEEELIDLNEHKRQFMEFAVGWKMLIAYCKSNNIKMLYSTWYYLENPNLRMFDRQNRMFINQNLEQLLQFISKKYPEMNISKKLLKKRDGHAGSIVHEYWKDSFIKEIEKRGLFND